MVGSQHAAESLAAPDLTGGVADSLARIDQAMVEGLVIALRVIRDQERNNGDM